MTFSKTIILGFTLLACASCAETMRASTPTNPLACKFEENSQISYAIGAPSPEIEKAVEWIIGLTGGEQNFTLHSAKFGDVSPIAFACQGEGERYIVYDRAYFHARDKVLLFSDIAILSHEILHHTSAHVTGIGKDSWKNELAADRFAGFVIASLGGSLSEAQSFAMMLSENGTPSHPPREKRLDAIEKGWRLKSE